MDRVERVVLLYTDWYKNRIPLECPLYEVDCKVVAKFNVRLEKLAGNHQDY